MKNNSNINDANRKALPKFLIFIFVSAIAGFVLGFLSSGLNHEVSMMKFIEIIKDKFIMIAPYLMWVCIIISSVLFYLNYSKAKKLFESWDEEDENVINTVEQKINYVLLISNTNLIISFFIFTASHYLKELVPFVIIVLGFIVSLALTIIFQQKAVDLTKQINPEKQGSVYDTKFQEKWLKTCDENEIRQIGQAAYKAFNVVNGVCIALWLITVFASYFLNLGFYPFIIITIIWLSANLAYIFEAIKLSK